VLNSELQSARSESERDGLTGILNRRTFDRYLTDLIARNTVTPQEVALLAGRHRRFQTDQRRPRHLTGDSVLVAVVKKSGSRCAGRMCSRASAARSSPSFYRGASLRNAMKRAGRSRGHRLDALRAGEPATREELALTVSIGVSCCRASDTVAL